MKQNILYTLPQTIGERIAFLREKVGATQKDFAEMLDISRGKLSQIEINRNEPDLALLRKIVTKCSTTYDWLIDGKMEGDKVPMRMVAEPEEKYVTRKELDEVIKKLKL